MNRSFVLLVTVLFAAACSPPSPSPDAQSPTADVVDAAHAADASEAVDVIDVFVDASCCEPNPGRNNPECVGMPMGLCISHQEGAACRWVCDGGQ